MPPAPPLTLLAGAKAATACGLGLGSGLSTWPQSRPLLLRVSAFLAERKGTHHLSSLLGLPHSQPGPDKARGGRWVHGLCLRVDTRRSFLEAVALVLPATCHQKHISWERPLPWDTKQASWRKRPGKREECSGPPEMATALSPSFRTGSLQVETHGLLPRAMTRDAR